MNAAADDFQIRGLREADLDRVTELGLELSQAPHWPRSVYEAVLDPNSPLRLALVAEDVATGRLVAFAVAVVLAPEAELESIAVVSSRQRHGLGRRLMAALMEELKRAEVNELMLEVRESNLAAIEFYRKLGFAETGRRARYYADPVEDAVLMKQWLGVSG